MNSTEAANRPFANGSAPPWRDLSAKITGKLEDFIRSPTLAIPMPGRPPVKLHTDRVRAKPAIAPQLSFMIGVTAIGLGAWGTLFPRAVRRTFGIDASANAIRGLFGLREMWSGYSLAGDPTRAEVLWARVAADVFDIALLRSLDNPENPKQANARRGLAFVLAVTLLDLITAARMSGVRRNAD